MISSLGDGEAIRIRGEGELGCARTVVGGNPNTLARLLHKGKAAIGAAPDFT